MTEQELEEKALKDIMSEKVTSITECKHFYIVGFKKGYQLLKEENECLKRLESYINDIPLVINPCWLCVNCTGVRGDITTHLTEKCKDCCYFYGSKFKVKE